MSADRLTVVLTLKDRAPFTERWLDYAAAVSMPFRILLADGSTDDAAGRMAERSRASGVNVDWLRYPVDNSYRDYYTKVADVLSRVTTPYVVLADNDDLYVPRSLSKAVAFLDEHPSYAACGGQCAVFWMASGDEQRPLQTLYGERVAWKCSSMMHSDVADTARQRIIDQSLGASDVFYAVQRTPVLRRQFEVIREFCPSDLFLMEQLVACFTAIAGKCHQLDVLYIARQQDSPGSSGGEHQDRFGGWFDRMLLPTWSADFTNFLDLVSAELARADDIPIEQARRVIVDCYKMSVAPSLLSELMLEPTVTPAMPLILQLVTRLVRLPRGSRLRRLALRCYRGLRWVSHDFVHGTELRARMAPDAGESFEPIRQFLTHPRRHHHSTTPGT